MERFPLVQSYSNSEKFYWLLSRLILSNICCILLLDLYKWKISRNCTVDHFWGFRWVESHIVASSCDLYNDLYKFKLFEVNHFYIGNISVHLTSLHIIFLTAQVLFLFMLVCFFGLWSNQLEMRWDRREWTWPK